MNAKTIAVSRQAYARLAGRKREGESFTKTIERLVAQDMERGSCADAVREAAIWGKAPVAGEAEVMERVIERNREGAGWEVEELK
ncbi:MAG: antitoxin VapB family protein [Oceanipulchritudo sp.]